MNTHRSQLSSSKELIFGIWPCGIGWLQLFKKVRRDINSFRVMKWNVSIPVKNTLQFFTQWAENTDSTLFEETHSSKYIKIAIIAIEKPYKIFFFKIEWVEYCILEIMSKIIRKYVVYLYTCIWINLIGNLSWQWILK